MSIREIVVEITPMARDTDSRLQIEPFLDQPQALSFKTCILARKLCTKLAHRLCHLLEKLSADGAALPRTPKHVINIVIHHRHRRRTLMWLAPSR